MTENWSRSDLDKLSKFNSEQYVDWLRQGLIDWDNPRENWRAFAPVQDRFSLRDDAEPQISEMFSVMSEREKQVFLLGLSKAFSEVEASDQGYALFDSLQRLAILLDRPEPAAAMVRRLRDDQFFANASDDVAQHLYAKGFLVISKLYRHADAAQLTARLIESNRFRKAYIPAVYEMLVAQQPGRFFDHLLSLVDYLADPEVGKKIIVVLRNIVGKLSSYDLIDAISSKSFYEGIASNANLSSIVKEGFSRNRNALSEGLMLANLSEQEGKASRAQAELTKAYDTVPIKNRFFWRGLSRVAVQSAAPGFSAQFPEEESLSRVAQYRESQVLAE